MEHLVAAFRVETQVLPIVGEQHHSLARILANVILQIRKELSAYALIVKLRINLNHTQVPYIGIVLLIIMARGTGLLILCQESMQVLPIGKKIHLQVTAQNELEYRWLLVAWWLKCRLSHHPAVQTCGQHM